MDNETLLAHCLAKPGAWPDNPFDQDFPVVKAGEGDRSKIFAFVNADKVGVKAALDRQVADDWVDRYPGAARPMPYLGRSGWNQLDFDGVPDDELLDAVDESYRLVVSRMPASRRPLGWEG